MNASRIAAAPDQQPPSESPVPDPTTGHGRSEASVTEVTEALVTACALARTGNPLLGVLATTDYVTRLVDHHHERHSPQETLRWRQFTFESEWTVRWDWAVDTVRRLYPDMPGVEALPDTHEDAHLPPVNAACVS